jgi:hypothetical protein
MGELDDPVVVEFPLRGEWSVERTPAHRSPSHGTDILGQRFAYDLVRTDHRPGFHRHPAGTLRSYLIGVRTRDCYGWGQPVHAAFDGEIVEAVDGVPERQWLHVVRESWVALKNAFVFGLARRGLDPARLAGNHVILRSGQTFALYAHLAREPHRDEGAGGPRRRGDRTRRPHRELDRPPPAFPADGFGGPPFKRRASRAPSRRTSCSATGAGSAWSAASPIGSSASARSHRPRDASHVTEAPGSVDDAPNRDNRVCAPRGGVGPDLRRLVRPRSGGDWH